MVCSEYEGVLSAGELRRVVSRRSGDTDEARRVRSYEPRTLSHPRLLRRLRGGRDHADGPEVLRTQAVPRARTGALASTSSRLSHRPRRLPGRRLHLHYRYVLAP